MSIIERAADKLQMGKSSPARPDPPHPADETAHLSVPEVAAAQLMNELGAPSSAASQDAADDVYHIDLRHLQASGAMPAEYSRERLEIEYRRIKRPLLANISGRGAVAVKDGRVIMVTSAQVGEGKTFTAFNLAYSFSQEPDWEVVLIDGDNVRRVLSSQLGLEEHVGLVDVLGDAATSLDDVLLHTDIPRLSFIPAGRRDPLASEYLSSRRMEQLIKQLTVNEQRIVLIDAPPLLGTSGALSLSEVAGQILLVIKAGATPRAAVTAAVQPLDRKKAINIVLNQVDWEHGDVYGRYHYGHSYGYSESSKSGD